MTAEETRWQAVRERKSSVGKDFVYGVRTTGIFCRPGCPARTPRRENVRFFADAQAAAAEGLRPCLRCKPLSTESAAEQAKFREVCVYLRKHLDDPDALRLANLSRHFGLSPSHLQRTFKAVVGVSPRRYVEALRMETLKEDLRSGRTVTDSIYSAGFGSSSRIYDRTDAHLGMTPTQYGAGGLDVAITYATAQTPLGLIMLGATDRGLCFVEFGDSEQGLLESLQQEFPQSTPMPMAEPLSDQFHGWMDALSNYLSSRSKLATVPLRLHGTAFQTRVWDYLQTLPTGTVQTYTEVAQAIGRPRAVRAVASACAANRIALFVPCHRVIRGDGGLGGYRWGLERKRQLLDLEHRTPAASVNNGQ